MVFLTAVVAMVSFAIVIIYLVAAPASVLYWCYNCDRFVCVALQEDTVVASLDCGEASSRRWGHPCPTPPTFATCVLTTPTTYTSIGPVAPPSQA